MESDETTEMGAENSKPEKDKKMGPYYDSKLVQLAKQGDRNAFGELVATYHAHAYSVALQITKNPEATEDVVQEALISAWKSITKFNGLSLFSTWLHRIVVNQSLMYLRRQGRKINNTDSLDSEYMGVLDTLISPNGNPEHECFRMELAQIIKSSIAELRPDFRAVIIMKCIEGMPHEKIGSVLGLSEIAAKTRLHRARKQLRELLSAHLGDDTIV